MKIEELVIATRNTGKFKYFTEALKNLPVKVLSLADLGINQDVEETGQTFEANSEQKAQFFYNLTKRPTLADDSGMAIDVLNGEPGPLSRRWPGHEASDEELVEFMLAKMKNYSESERTAKFISVITVILDEDTQLQSRGEISGIILNKPAIPYKPGLPWSSFFYIPEIDKVHGALTIEESKQFSHRGQALNKIKDQLSIYLNND